MKLAATHPRATRRAAFTLLEVLVVVAILVILAGVGIVATTRYLEDAKKSQAQLKCKGLAQAVEAFTLHPANLGNVPPTQLNQLVSPGFGTSFLKNGEQDYASPWGPNGPQFVLEYRSAQDGVTQIPLVHITAPDQTQISQYGIGQAANPPQNQ